MANSKKNPVISTEATPKTKRGRKKRDRVYTVVRQPVTVIPRDLAAVTSVEPTERLVLVLPISIEKIQEYLKSDDSKTVEEKLLVYNPNLSTPVAFGEDEPSPLESFTKTDEKSLALVMNMPASKISFTLENLKNLEDRRKEQESGFVYSASLPLPPPEKVAPAPSELVLPFQDFIPPLSIVPPESIARDTMMTSMEELPDSFFSSTSGLQSRTVIVNPQPNYISSKNLLPQTGKSIEIRKVFDILPLFKTVSTKTVWPKETNIHCWHCCHPFEGMPFAVPNRYYPKTQEFSVTGCFCSIHCAMAYIRIHNPRNQYLLRFMYLSMIAPPSAKRAGELAKIQINPAPPRETLIEFGGTKTIEEFRKSFENKYEITKLPLIMTIQQVTETSFAYTTPASRAPGDGTLAGFTTSIASDKKTPIHSAPSATAPKKLRIYRNNPIQSTVQSSLTSVIKMK